MLEVNNAARKLHAHPETVRVISSLVHYNK